MLNAVIYDEDKEEFVAVEQGTAQKYDSEFTEVRTAQLELAASYSEDNEQALYDHLSRISAENYEPDVTSVNERCANIFWRGGSDESKLVASHQRRTDVIYTPEGLKLYPGWYGENKTLTYWVSNDENYRFVLSIQRGRDGRGNVVVTCWRNRKVGANGGRWQGRIHQFRTGTQYNAGDWQLPSSEQRAILWLMKAVSKVATP